MSSILEELESKAADVLDAMITEMDGQADVPEPVPENKPDYMKDTWASSRSNCGNDEMERIRNSFRTGSWWTLKKLPAALAAGNVEESRRQNTLKNRIGRREFRFKAPVHTTYFRRLDYTHSDYDKMRMKEKNDTEKNQMKTASFSRTPFVVSNRMKTLTEDTFEDKEYKIPYMGPGSNKMDMSQLTRSDVDDNSLFRAGPFNPAGKRPTDVTRGLIKEWVEKIYKKLAADWPEHKFTVKWSQRDEMEILFTFGDQDNSGPPPSGALSKYMNNLAVSGLAAELKLIRRGDSWNVTTPRASALTTPVAMAEGLLFVFYAPWVKRGSVVVRKAMSAFQRDQVRTRRDIQKALDLGEDLDKYGAPVPTGHRPTPSRPSRGMM